MITIAFNNHGKSFVKIYSDSLKYSWFFFFFFFLETENIFVAVILQLNSFFTSHYRQMLRYTTTEVKLHPPN